jgi:membrane fusion protein, epimerase transport system
MSTQNRDNRPAPTPRSSQDYAQGIVRTGAWIIALAVLPIGAWIFLAPLSMAVVAPGSVKVDLNRRPVQHLEGGIVHTVLVRNGQRVNAGDPVLMLGDVRVSADRNRLAYRVDAERASLSRLQAEQALASHVAFPEHLLKTAKSDPRVFQALAKERSLFNTRRESLNSEVALMGIQKERIEHEMTSLRAQIEQTRISLELQQKFLESNRGLVKDGFISSTRIEQIQATVADYAAKIEQQRSELARAAQRQADVDLKIRTIQNQYAQAASDQLKETAARFAELEQEQRKSEDAAQRQIVTAPASGEILDLKFTSPGSVIRPGEPIAEIVPCDANLLIEAQIRPEDISNVHQGQFARVKFTAFKYRNSRMVSGKVTYVAADRLTDQFSRLPYYSVLIQADVESLRESGDLIIQAGMPAEVYIEGSKQTAFEYLAEPVMATVRKAGRSM